MLKKLYKKSEVWFAVVFIIAYVVGDSYLIQASESAGIEMIYTIPYNLLLLGIMYAFVGRTTYLDITGLIRSNVKLANYCIMCRLLLLQQ